MLIMRFVYFYYEKSARSGRNPSRMRLGGYMNRYTHSAAAATLVCIALGGCAQPKIAQVKSAPDVSAVSTVSAEASNAPDDGRLGLTAPSDTADSSAPSAPSDAAQPSAEPRDAQIAIDDSLPMGTNGRLYFDDGTSVALNTADSSSLDAIQYVTDLPDSAYYGYDGYTAAICDHSRQAFGNLPNLPVGSHMTIVDTNGARTDYTMVSRHYATWADGYSTLDDGRSPWDGDTRLFLQTCINAAGTRDVITYWEPEN